MGAGGNEISSVSVDLHNPVTIEQTSTILDQMKETICKLKTKHGKGTGFFCSLPHEKKKINVLIANNYILDKNILSSNSTLNFTLNNDKEEKSIEIDGTRKIYMNKEYNITIIEITKKDKIDKFLELDEDMLNIDFRLQNDSIYMLQYSKINKNYSASVSYGIATTIDKYDIINYCSTKTGAIGSPILNLSNNKVVGIHREISTKYTYNKATFLKYPIEEFLKEKNIVSIEPDKGEDNSDEDDNEDVKSGGDNKEAFIEGGKKKEDGKASGKKKEDGKASGKKKEDGKTSGKKKEDGKSGGKNKEDSKSSGNNEITIQLKIDKNDLNKEVYFLDNTNIFDENLVKHYHDYLKELKDSNVEMYINDKEHEYQKFYKFTEEGTYTIKLKFKNRLKDCSYMFCNCVNITNIDLSKFDTKNMNDMCRMFYNCENLTEIDLSTFNTSKVTSMYSMFEQCYKLKSLDLSSFETEQVTSFGRMFYGCKKLEKLDLSSFEDDNIEEIKGILKGCKNLKEVKITKNFYDRIKSEMPSDKIEFVLI